MFEDPLFWVFVIPGLLLGLYAQWRIKLNVAKYSQVATQDGITGAEVARRLLDSKGLQNVAVESTPGILSDHYDPRSKTLRLSQQVYFAPSVAAAGIAAHEAGHALQDAEDYFPMEARTYIVPIVQIAAQVAPWLFIIGVLLQLETLTWAGVILFGPSFLLAMLTLPGWGPPLGPTWQQLYLQSVSGFSTFSFYFSGEARLRVTDKPNFASSPLSGLIGVS